MSKRDLKKYLTGLDKEQIEEQLLALYDKFPDVKTYYDFVFHPKEEKMVGEARVKISNEYFPAKTRRAKLRRSTAQKIIKHFLMLGVEPHAVADVMLFAIEVAQKYTARREVRSTTFYKSMHKSFEQAVDYTIAQGIVGDFNDRITSIAERAASQQWDNVWDFERTVSRI